MQYEHENVREPTCKGRWWMLVGGRIFEIVMVDMVSGEMGRFHCGRWRPCREDGITWTGPIPEPETEPAPSEKEFKSGVAWIDALVTEHLKNTTPAERLRLMDEAEAKTSDDMREFARIAGSAPSENEGEECGRRLFQLIRASDENWNELVLLDYCKREALRFRDKCFAPWKDVVDKARAVLQAFRGYGDLVNEATKHNWSDEEVAAAERKVGSEVGGAMEALDDAFDALPDQGEPPAEEKLDRGRHADVDAEGQVETGDDVEGDVLAEAKPAPSEDCHISLEDK